MTENSNSQSVSESLENATRLTEQLVTDTPAREEPVARPEPHHVLPREKNSVRRSLQFAEQLSPQALLLALKRRWRQAVIIGVPVFFVALAAGWLFISAHYTAFALLKLASKEPRLVFQTAETESDFFTYQKTQKALIRSRFVLNAALRIPGISDLSLIRAQAYPLQWLEKNVEVDSYNSPEILRIGLTGDHPEQLSKIVNAVKDAYLNEVVLAERKARIARLSDLERIFEQTEDKVRSKEQRVENLAKQLGSGDIKALSFKQQMALEHFSLLKREHARVRFELMRAEIHRTAVSELDSVILPASKDDKTTSLRPQSDQPLDQDARILLAQRRIAQLKNLIARYESSVVDPNHPSLQKYRDELAAIKSAIGQSATNIEGGGTRLELLTRQEKLMREELDKYAQLVKTIGTSSFELELMKTEINQIAKISDRVGSEMEALRIELQSPTRVTLLQESDVPKTRDMDRKRNLTSAAGVGAFGIVLLIVSVVEFHSRRITEPKDVSETLGLDLLGTLPAMPKSWLKLWNRSKQARISLWNNALVESVDSIRSILLHGGDNAKRVLMVASASSGEGKTTFACQLAGSLARAGRKTILVDCDIRRPRVHQLLEVPLELGLSEALSDGLQLETAIHRTRDENLDVLPAGKINDAALQSIARDGAKRVFEQLRNDYEFVIVDSSPILYVADGGAIGKNVDGSIIVVRSHVSRLPSVAVACERLEMMGIEIVGSVMVGVRANLGGYGYSYDYHYNSMGANV
jgi:capsular exopolysaccharide synthesis family protein